MEKKFALTADVQSLSKDIASLLRNEEYGKHYLDMTCGEVKVCRCLMAAASSKPSGMGSEAQAALSNAPPDTATRLVRFAYGDDVTIDDEAQLLELLPLAKSIGINSCVEKCRMAIGQAAEMDFPITLKPGEIDANRQRERLRRLYFERQFLDIALRPSCQQCSDGTSDGDTERRDIHMHRFMLAAASPYFAAMWTHGFADGFSSGPAVDVEADASIALLLVKCIYGETINLALEEIVNIYVLADKYQIMCLASPALAQIEQHLAPAYAVELLTTSISYPDPILQAALVKTAAETAMFKVVLTFMSDSETSVELKQGLLGTVLEIDKDRRCLKMRFHGIGSGDSDQWIFKPNFDKMIKVQPLEIVLLKNPCLLARVLSGAVSGLPSHVTNAIVAKTKGSPQRLDELVGSSDWLKLGTEAIAQVCTALAMHEGEQDLLKNGVVAWAQEKASTPHNAITLIKLFYSEYSRAQAKREGLQSWHAMHLLKDLSGRLLLAYGEEALPVVQEVFTEKRSGETSSGRKRAAEDADDEHFAIVHAAARWGKAHAKKLRTSHMWPSTQPDAMVAVLEGDGSQAGVGDKSTGVQDDDIEAAAVSWATPATLSSCLEALGRLGTPVDSKLFHVLLASAQEKGAALESQNLALGGHGLRDATEARRQAETQATVAKTDADVQKSRADASELKAFALEKELAQERHWIDELKTAMTALLAKPRPTSPD